MKLKKLERMTKEELLVFFLMAISSGIVIGVGGVSSLIANALLGDWGRLIGAVLFSLGIYAIVVYEMRLFTGMVADIPTLGLKNTWQLAVCFLGNVIGVAIIAVVANFSFAADIVVKQGGATILNKLNVDDWAIRAFCSSVLCGVLITISVKSVKFAPRKGVSSSVGVMFPIVVFAFCGFDHSVANMLYFFYLGECSWRVVGYIAVSLLGNIVGGVGLPTITLLKECAQRKRQRLEEQNAAK